MKLDIGQQDIVVVSYFENARCCGVLIVNAEFNEEYEQ